MIILWEVEAHTIRNEYGDKISMTEVHTIAADRCCRIKKHERTCSTVKNYCRDTDSCHKQSCKKGFVERYKTERDRRVVKVALTKEGKKIYSLHEKFPTNDIAFALIKGLSESEMDVVAKSLG